MTDAELADAWLAGELGSISHEDHVRIAFVLLRQHGREQGTQVLEEVTLKNSTALGEAEKYDAELTRRWASLIADALQEADDGDADALLRRRPELLRGDLLGLPAWKRA